MMYNIILLLYHKIFITITVTFVVCVMVIISYHIILSLNKK